RQSWHPEKRREKEVGARQDFSEGQFELRVPQLPKWKEGAWCLHKTANSYCSLENPLLRRGGAKRQWSRSAGVGWFSLPKTPLKSPLVQGGTPAPQSRMKKSLDCTYIMSLIYLEYTRSRQAAPYVPKLKVLRRQASVIPIHKCEPVWISYL